MTKYLFNWVGLYYGDDSSLEEQKQKIKTEYQDWDFVREESWFNPVMNKTQIELEFFKTEEKLMIYSIY